MDEFSFIDSIKQSTYRQASLLKGIGDDAAVFRSNGYDQVVAVDTFVEGVHFTKETMLASDVGYRALAANLSDLAAMGAVPNYYLVSIVVPSEWQLDEIQAIFHGMNELANKFKIDLIGGDTVSGKELVLSVTVIGSIEKGKSRFRYQAEEKDIVFVTGTLGDSGCGLHVLLNKLPQQDVGYSIQRHRRPTPRIEFSRKLATIDRVALNDISDGLANEAEEIATASNIRLNIDASLIPIHDELRKFPKELQRKWQYFGGEDFELLGTVAREEWPIVQRIADETGTVVTEIGHVVRKEHKEKHNVWLLEDGKYRPLNKAGYIHLK